LDEHDVARASVVEALRAAIEDDRTDLEALYGLMLDTLERSTEARA